MRKNRLQKALLAIDTQCYDLESEHNIIEQRTSYVKDAQPLTDALTGGTAKISVTAPSCY